ncbi:MAG: selenide, water dikinase SelD [Gemmatimonadaceae bacterium]
MGPGDLSRALDGLPRRSDSRLLVGHETMDDAGVFVLSEDLALVQTVDFFAPIVDDPYLFGQVAAANALSDVYAMGGEPLTALNIVGFPSGRLPLDVLREILRGGQDKVHEAGALIVGGHTIIDEELKYGLSVTGRAHPKRLLTNAAARVGDRLVLTKPIGTALLATAAKNGELPEAELRALSDSMRSLNASASKVALEVGARCATDITGFGLLGHASHIAKASGVTLRITVSRVPLLPGARAVAERGVRTGGAERNLAYLESRVEWGKSAEVDRVLMIDPQTSGGLLVALSVDQLARYLSLVPGATEIGEVVPAGPTGLALA